MEIPGRLLLDGLPKWKVGVWDEAQVNPALVRPPALVILFLFLWALNVWCYESNRLHYTKVLPGMKGVSLPFLLSAPVLLAFMYYSTFHILTAMGCAPATVLFVFYTFICCILGAVVRSASVSPVIGGVSTSPTTPGGSSSGSSSGGSNATGWSLVVQQVKPFLDLLHLVFAPNPHHISFSEILLADALCSLSKVFKDVGIYLVALYSHMAYTPTVEAHDGAMLLVAMLASIPFALRVRQCSIQLMNESSVSAGLPICINIIKYLSSFFPIWLAAAASLGVNHKQMPYLMVVFATINSSLSFCWDIVMDWGLISIKRRNPNVPCSSLQLYFRPRLLLPLYTHVLAAAINLCLRFSWTATMIPAFAGIDSATLVLLVEVAEVLRRAMWNVFRVEWQIINEDDNSNAAEDKSLIKD